MDSLAKVASSLDDDPASALAAALEVWRRFKTAELAALVEGLAPRAPPRRLNPRVAAPAYHAAWLELARGARAADLDTLLGTLLRAVPLDERHEFWQPGY